MRILWLTNFIIPEVADEIKIQNDFVNEGWISQMFKQLCLKDDIEMNIICCNAPFESNGQSSSYKWFTSPQKTCRDYQIISFSIILQTCKPDVIHIWGSEFPHTLNMLKAANQLNYLPRVIISIQGIIHIIAYHYLDQIPHKVLQNKTFHDILRHNSLYNQKKVFELRGIDEKESLRMCHHVIGRTLWDYYCVKRINPTINYHFCNETLRKPFYDGCWDYKRCQKHSIFVSQATYPIKGFHILLKALPNLINRYPDLHVYVAGANITKDDNGYRAWFLRSGYGKYIHDIIKKHELKNHISFIGKLDVNQMKAQYLRANVSVSPSIIENSSNSVGEAMILGCPVVCSDVGGIRSIIKDRKEGLTYPYNEYYILECCIDWVFSHPHEASEMGTNARNRALRDHDSKNNLKQLLSIYNSISTQENNIYEKKDS